MILIDLDHFKKVNDRFGHGVGDVLLVEFARLVKDILRPYDIFGRFGGEEFLILSPNTSLHQAVNFANRIQKKIENHIFIIEDLEIKITASFGVSDYTQGAATLDKLIKFADKALLQSKQQGKNLVSSHPLGTEK